MEGPKQLQTRPLAVATGEDSEAECAAGFLCLVARTATRAWSEGIGRTRIRAERSEEPPTLCSRCDIISDLHRFDGRRSKHRFCSSYPINITKTFLSFSFVSSSCFNFDAILSGFGSYQSRALNSSAGLSFSLRVPFGTLVCREERSAAPTKESACFIGPSMASPSRDTAEYQSKSLTIWPCPRSLARPVIDEAKSDRI